MSAPDAAVARWASARETSASAEDEAAESRASVRKATSFASARTASITVPSQKARVSAHASVPIDSRPSDGLVAPADATHADATRSSASVAAAEAGRRVRARERIAGVGPKSRERVDAVRRRVARRGCDGLSRSVGRSGKTAARLAPQLSTPVDFVMTTVPARREFLESRTARYSIRPEHVESAPVLPTFCQPGVAV